MLIVNVVVAHVEIEHLVVLVGPDHGIISAVPYLVLFRSGALTWRSKSIQRCRLSYCRGATTIPQPDAMNSTEANQTSPIICEGNYVQRGYYYREDYRQ